MDIIQNGIQYMCDDDYALVYKCTDIYTDILIPDVVERRTVIGIWDEAFKNCNSLHRITIPSTIQKIGKEAFKNCANLLDFCFYRGYLASSQHIRTDFLTIGERAFEHCGLLESFEACDRVLIIGKEAFAGCSNLQNVSRIRQAEPFCFRGCSYLTDLFFVNNFNFNTINLFWNSSFERYHLMKNAIIDKYAIDFLKRKNIQICCPQNSKLVDLAYEGVNIKVKK